MKLELGAGLRPTRGYEHNDLHPFPHIEHVGEPWMLDLPDASLDEVFALAFIEHLTYDHALDTFRNVHRMLKGDGLFLFDVPDYPTWAAYYLERIAPGTRFRGVGPTLEHCRSTLFGWQRWPGDEHLFGWDMPLLKEALESCGFRIASRSVEPFKARAYRQRFDRNWDAHFYITAVPA